MSAVDEMLAAVARTEATIARSEGALRVRR